MLCQVPDRARRAILRGSGALFAWSMLPKLASAAGARDSRLVVIVLRGALDGLSAVAPIGDPDYAALHGALALTPGGEHPALPLDGFFALNPAMPAFAKLYAAGQAAVIHAVATPYRDRSHFDGQDVLESGLGGTGRIDSGWLNRALAAMPAADRVTHAGAGLAVGPTTPLIMRGSAPVLGWAPPAIAAAGEDLAARVMALYAARDPRLAASLAQGLATDRLAAGTMSKAQGGPDSPQAMRAAAEGAARLLAADDGPRVAALCFDGWDTHVNEGGATGRLAQLLGGLDGALDALHTGLGSAWGSTAVLVATEFGRTVHINGTVGTDHGTGTVAFLAGGAIRGGRVVADWPGLAAARLLDGRDLRPTTDLRSVAKALLVEHLGLPAGVVDTAVFPDSAAAPALRALVA